VWSDAENWQTGHWLTGRLGAAPLDRLIGAILADAGVSDADTRDLREGPLGYVIDRPMAPRAAIDPLALAFAFDAMELDGILQFRQRGGLPAVELSEDDLILPDRGAPARLVRTQESDLPREVTLTYTDVASDYQRAAASSRRLAGAAQRTSRAEIAMVADGAEAQRRVEIWLQDLWAGRESAEFTLPPSRLALTLGDIAGITVNGRRRLVELQEIVDAESRAVRARSIDPETFALALPPPRSRPPVIPPALGPVHALALDLPTLQSEQPPVVSRLAVFADPWPGPETVWGSRDGESFAALARAEAPCIVGETLDDLPAGPTARWHNVEFRVTLYGGVLASVSDAVLLAGANAAAVQRADGAWEVLQFANAELIAPKVYRLSRLLRGQAGSEWAMGAPLTAHAPFVLLDRNLINTASGLESLDRELQLRIAAASRDYADPSAFALSVTPQATALKPLAPVHVGAKRDGAGVTFIWIRRTRIDGDSWSGEVPLGEDSEQYALDVLSGGSVVRTLASTTPAALYAAADEIADFGAPQATLHVRVMQISATVGRGFATDIILSP
jgi:hypothetical protein